jgi:FkbM family methyltransferase
VIRGHRMLLPRQGELTAWYLTNNFEQGVTEFFEQSLHEGMTVVDGGANVGYYTLLAARRVGRSGQVYAFEPQSDNYALLVRNIELNGYTNVIPVRKALGDRSETGTLHLRDSGTHSLYPAGSTSGRSESVDVVTLDEFLESEGSPDIDLVKLDLQGSEPAAIDGMRRLLERSQTLRLVLQLDDQLLKRAGVDAALFLEHLHSIGFDVAVLDGARGPAPDVTQVLSRVRDEAFNVLCQRA